MKHWQTVAIIALILALAGAVGWALAERSARQKAQEALIVQTMNDSQAKLRQGRRLVRLEQKIEPLETSLAALEKWRNGAESRLAAAAKRRPEPGLFRGIDRFVPGGPGRVVALDGERTQRFSLKDKHGNAVNVSLMGAAHLDEELARELGLDAAKREKLNKLIRKENRRWAEKLIAKREPGEGRGLDFGLGGGDDGWADFVGCAKMKKLLGEEARRKFLERFPRRSTMHLITAGPGGMGIPHVRIHPHGERPDRPVDPKKGADPAPPPEQF